MQNDDTLPREERVKRVNALLRQVDEDVRKGALEAALEKIRKVYTLDIKNIYARAYEERILVKMLEKERSQIEQKAAAKAEGQIESDMKRWIEEFQQHQVKEERARRKLESLDAELEQRARAAALSEIMERVGEVERRLSEKMENVLSGGLVSPGGRNGQGELKVVIDPGGNIESLRQEYEEKLATVKRISEEEQRRFREEAFTELAAEHRKTEQELLRQIELERETIAARESEKLVKTVSGGYSAVLSVMMQLGVPDSIQDSISSTLQTSLGIHPSRHPELLSAARQHVFAQAARAAWASGHPSREDLDNLANIGLLYSIPAHEQSEAVARIKKELGLPDENAIILAIDDDPVILKFIEHALKQTYSTVLTAHDVDSALAIVEHQQPSLILCDVQMPVMGGFGFYEKIASGAYGTEMQRIPFLFMSSITDDFFIRSAKELGVQSYLTKPFTRETLEQTVRRSTC